MNTASNSSPSVASQAAASPSRPGVYEVGRPSNHCFACGRELPPGTQIVAALRETPAGLERVDLDTDCWKSFERTGLLAFWQTHIPQPNAKKKVFVDDAVLCELFERLGDTAEAAKLNFRFVLGLILMRKRMLIYESSREHDGRDVWIVRLRGKDSLMEMLNPHLNEQQVAEVSQQLGDILNETL